MASMTIESFQRCHRSCSCNHRLKLQEARPRISFGLLLVLLAVVTVNGSRHDGESRHFSQWSREEHGKDFALPRFQLKKKFELTKPKQETMSLNLNQQSISPIHQHEESKEEVERSKFASMKLSFLSLFSDPSRLLRFSMKAVQVSLILYVSHAVWRAVTEVIEEFSQEQVAGDQLFCPRDAIPRTLSFLLQHPSAIATTSDAALPVGLSRPVLELAQKLLASGLPLTSSSPSSSSVESVLLQLTRLEASLLQQCLWVPRSTSQLLRRSIWDSIAGLQDVKEGLAATMEIIHRGENKPSHAFASLFDQGHHTQHHQGILLYGPPGCGKSLLVKALASTVRMPCLVITPSVLLRKYVGDTNLQVRSLFSLASKLAPAIVCIDELDGLFRERHEQEHDVSREFKTEFLQWLSGVPHQMQQNRSLVVIGATNRPFDVDPAILRRLPQSFFIGLPDSPARFELLETLLQDVPLDKRNGGFDMRLISDITKGYSPSDLRQLLQTSVLMGPLRDQQKGRPLTTTDVINTMKHIKATPLSQTYCVALTRFAKLNSNNPPRFSTSDDPFEPCATPDKWETPLGNFYHVGTMELDHDAILRFKELLKEMEKFSADMVDDHSNPDDEDEHPQDDGL